MRLLFAQLVLGLTPHWSQLTAQFGWLGAVVLVALVFQFVLAFIGLIFPGLAVLLWLAMVGVVVTSYYHK